MKITRHTSKAYKVNLGPDNYSILIDGVSVQTSTLTTMKCKGGMRDCFVCPPGYVWLSADYSSQEMVLMANFSNEPNLINPLLQGEDIHKYVGTKMFGHYDKSHRTIAKTINFASNYGASGYTIGKRLGKTTEEGQALLDKYNSTMSKLYAWKQEMIKEGRRKGIVYTYFGRPRAVWQYYQSSDPSKHSFGDRTCMNSPVQGTGGDIIRLDYVKYTTFIDPSSPHYDKEFAEKTKHALTVHDEINIFVHPDYVPKAFDKLKEIMEMQYPNWKVPLKVSPSVGVDWGHQIEARGFTKEGELIPDCDEDLSLL